MTQHGKYGDTPLGKSDEELRAEGAEALTEDERLHRTAAGSEAEVISAVPLASAGVQDIPFPAVINTQIDSETGERKLQSGEE